MKKLGFVISSKENEKRRAIILDDAMNIKNRDYVYFEEGYGEVLEISDECLKEKGFNVLPHEKIYDCDIICDPKIGDSDYISELKNKIVFGWIHATQNYDITQVFVENGLTGYAWEKLFECERHVLEKNNQIAGEAAILHSMLVYGDTFENLKIAILGNGNTSKGVQEILKKYNCKFKVYTSSMEQQFKKEFCDYDIIVNCILWDVCRNDHIIYRDDLKKMKSGSMIIDISCDKNGGIETSEPTTIENPTYVIENVIHYVVDHTPSMLYRKASRVISGEIVKYIDFLIEGKENKALSDSLIIKDGVIIDNEIIKYQKR